MAGTYRILSKHSRQRTIIQDKKTKYLIRSLLLLAPMVIAPMASYDFLIFYFKHSTVIYGSMIFGLMVGMILLLASEVVPQKILRK